MEVFQDFEITGERTKLTTLLSELVRKLPPGWRRDASREREIQRQLPNTRQFAFQVAATNERPAANLFVAVRSTTLAVTNVVPKELGRLTRAQYNSFIEEFAQIASPIANGLGLQTRITSSQLDIGTLLSPEAFKRLQAFSSGANKSTGSAHPMDRERWLQFIVQEHLDGGRLDGETLRRWLMEQERWPENEAYDLEIEFEFGSELLRAFEKERR